MKQGNIDEENLPLDFSMTKTVVGMLSAAIIGSIAVSFSCTII